MTTQVFQVLLSLADEPRHGYAIIQEIEQRTGGEVRLTASTLYDALARLVDQGLISEIDAGAMSQETSASLSAKPDARRRYYQLTTAGRGAAEQEAHRLARALAMARAKKIIG